MFGGDIQTVLFQNKLRMELDVTLEAKFKELYLHL